MKKGIIATLCLALILGLTAFAAGCGGNSDAVVYTVTVTGGTGGGRYYANDNCKVVAVVPEGKQFMKWVADNEDVSADEEYVFTVTDNVELTAVFGDFADNADDEVYTVKAIDGIGSGGYLENSQATVKLTREEADRSFKGWATVDADGNPGEIVSENNPYTFSVTQDVTLAAQFNDVRLDTPYGTLCRISSTPAWGDVILELDRVKDENGTGILDENGKYATMFDGRIQGIMIHVYDSVYAGKPVASFMFVQQEDIQKGKLVSLDGTTEFAGIQGGPGNYYRDWISMNDFAPFMRAVVGEKYSAETAYYFASQLIAKEEAVAWGEDGQMQLFANSRISALNAEYFCETK